MLILSPANNLWTRLRKEEGRGGEKRGGVEKEKREKKRGGVEKEKRGKKRLIMPPV